MVFVVTIETKQMICRTVNANTSFRLKVTAVCVSVSLNIVYILHTDTSRRRRRYLEAREPEKSECARQ